MNGSPSDFAVRASSTSGVEWVASAGFARILTGLALRQMPNAQMSHVAIIGESRSGRPKIQGLSDASNRANLRPSFSAMCLSTYTIRPACSICTDLFLPHQARSSLPSQMSSISITGGTSCWDDGTTKTVGFSIGLTCASIRLPAPSNFSSKQDFGSKSEARTFWSLDCCAGSGHARPRTSLAPTCWRCAAPYDSTPPKLLKMLSRHGSQSAPRVLLVYGLHPATTARYIHEAFRRIGASVQSAGPGPEIVDDQGHTYPTSRSPDLRDLLSQAGDVDLVVWVESPWLREVANLRHSTAPVVFWAIDSHMPGAWKRHASIAEQVSHTYVAQLAFLARVSLGRSSVSWLPLACAPEYHRPVLGPQDHDIAFVGNVSPSSLHSRRRTLLARLEQEFRVLCTTAPREEMSAIYGRAAMGFNCSVGGDLNMRVFEVLASGRPLLTDYVPGSGLSMLLRPGEDFLQYRTHDECVAQARQLLAEPEFANELAAKGLQAVRAHHTYEHRASLILNECLDLARPARAAARPRLFRTSWSTRGHFPMLPTDKGRSSWERS